MQYLLSHEFYKNFNISITLYRKQKILVDSILVDSKCLEIAHMQISRRLPWSQKHFECCALKRTKPDFQCQPMKKDHIIKCVFHGFQGMQHGNTWVLICL